MPSNGERRQVAVWLRDVADAVLPESADDDVLGFIVRSIHPSEAAKNCEVLRRLADLIEPQEHICLGCIKWSAIEGNPVKGVCAEFSDPEAGIERATPCYGYCHEWEDE